MSRHIPYHNYGKQLSPGMGRLSDKSRMGRSVLAQSTIQKKHMGKDQGLQIRVTEKKKTDATTFRIETLIEQNKFLLQENNQMSGLLQQKCHMVRLLENKLQQQIAQQVKILEQIQIQKDKFITQFYKKTQHYQQNIDDLLSRIRAANEQKANYQAYVNIQIQKIKEQYSRENKLQIQTISFNHARSMELVEIEIGKLKGKLEDKQCQMIKFQQSSQLKIEKARIQVQNLNNTILHLNHMKKMQLSQQKVHYENIIEHIKKQGVKQRQVQIHQHNVQIKKIKNDLTMKQAQAEKLCSDIETTNIENNLKMHSIQNKKIQLYAEIQQLENTHQKMMREETKRIQLISQAQINNIQVTSQCYLQSLKVQNQKLIALNQTKAQEIDNLMNQINNMRLQHSNEINLLESTIQQFKAKIFSVAEDNVVEDQKFKIKMAHLREADIKSLKEYYQNQASKLAENNAFKDDIICKNRQKLHAELQEKAIMRKQYDMQIQKLRIKIGELELRLAGTLAQKKEQINKMGSQMQLTSMTLIRDFKQKQKKTVFNEEQKRRLQKIVDAKDTEIGELAKRINLMKVEHLREINNKNQEIQISKKNNADLETQIKKQREFYDNDLAKKETNAKKIKEFYEGELTKLKNQFAEEYQKTVKELSQTKGKLEVQVARLKKNQSGLDEQLNTMKQIKQRQIIQKEVIINEQTGRLKVEKQKLQITLKKYYEQQLQQSKKQIQGLKHQLSQKQQDIRDLRGKYYSLQKKLQQLIQSQQKLKTIQNKIINLGQQNNVVKNLAQIVKMRKK